MKNGAVLIRDCVLKLDCLIAKWKLNNGCPIDVESPQRSEDLQQKAGLQLNNVQKLAAQIKLKV